MDYKLFSYDKGIEYPRWVSVKWSTAACPAKDQAAKAKDESFRELADFVSLLTLTTKQLDEYKEGVAEQCKLDLSYKMYEKEKDAFDNVHATEKNKQWQPVITAGTYHGAAVVAATIENGS